MVTEVQGPGEGCVLVVTQKRIWPTGKTALESTQQLYNDDAGRRVSARIESCFQPQEELLLADLLACPSRDPGAYDPRGSGARIPP